MGRAPCCEKLGLNRGAWTREEDLKLMRHIAAHGEGSWRTLPKAAGLSRCGKSCRLRWINYLRPDLKRGNITEEEDKLIIKLHSVLGNRWSLIAGRLPGRTDNEIKNYWNTHLKKKLKSMGIDPNTHQPLPMSINMNHSNSLYNHQKQSQNSNNNSSNYNNNNNNMLMSGNGMRYLASSSKSNNEKGGLFSKNNINKLYEIDRYLSSATASTANPSVIRTTNHFDYKAKPMFSLGCSTASVISDDSSALALLPPPLGVSSITRCNSVSSSISSAPSPPSKNPSAEYCQAFHLQYTFSKDLAYTKHTSPIQAYTQNPSSIQAPTDNPSPIQAFTKNPSSFHTHTKNPSPIQAFTEHPSSIQAHTNKAIQAFTENPSPNHAHIQNPSPVQAYAKNTSPFLALTASDEDFTKNPATSVLSTLETDFMWDFEMGVQPSSSLEEEANLRTPTQAESLQTLWGASNSWLSEQLLDQKLA